MENLPDELVQLIDRFKEHLEQYKGVSYDEANTHTDFIDPLFELLSWDVANKPTLSKGIKRGQKETPPCGGVGPTSKTLGMLYKYLMWDTR